MAAVGNVSKDLAKDKQNGQELATKQDIQDMLNTALEKQGIKDQTTSDQVSQISVALYNFQNAPISSSKTYINNVTNTINNVKNSTGDLMNKAKDWANSAQAKEAVDQAKGWFTRFIEWLKGLFGQQ